MRGYFSRLIQQTGIAAGITGGSRSGALEQPLLRSKEPDMMPSIYADKERLTVSQQEQAGGAMQEDTGKGSGSQIQGSESEKMIQREVEERSGNRLSHGLQERKPLERRVAAFDKDFRSRQEKVLLRREINELGSPGSDEAIGVENLDKKQSHPSGKPSTSANQEYKKSTPLKSAKKATDRIIRAQTWQSYLKDAIEWVAGAPAVNDGKIKYGEAIKAENAEKRKTFSPGRDEPEMDEPEIHDLHLSIGTISLVVERPQEKIQNKEPPQIIKVESKSGRENEASRLSRHYIRI